MINKKDYLRGRQCSKMFWMNRFGKSFVPKDDQALNLSREGQELKTLAQMLFDGNAVFGKSFEFENLFIRCDILEKSRDGYNLYAVKSSTGIRETYLDELTFQYYVLKKNEVNIRDISLIYLNKDYVREDELDIQKLFIKKSLKTEVEERTVDIEEKIKLLKELSETEKEPKTGIGIHCVKYGTDDSECGFKDWCWKHIPVPSVFDVANLRMKKKFQLYDEGKITFESLTDEKLSPGQKIQIESYLKQEENIDKTGIEIFLKKFKKPIYFLDFESYNPAVPEFTNTKPYQQIPFQYSMHVLSEEGILTHYEFLAEPGKDDRRNLAEALISQIGQAGTIAAYNMAFEKMIIKYLAEVCPDLSSQLLELNERFADLIEPFKNRSCYKVEMKGSSSIKYVLPALFPDDPQLSYENLYIPNGLAASTAFKNLQFLPAEERQKVREGLLEYCKLDTLAMVKIYDYLCSLTSIEI